MQNSIIFLCALALFIEAVLPAPGAFDLQAFEDTDNTADLATAAPDARKDGNPCPPVCLGSTRVVSSTNPDLCSGCYDQTTKGQAAKN